MRRVEGGDWEQLKEILPGDFQNGRTTFTSLLLEAGKTYSFRIGAHSASGVMLGASAEVTI